MRNEYEVFSPEWVLFQGLMASRRRGNYFVPDQRAQSLAQKYEAALKKLDPDFQGGT